MTSERASKIQLKKTNNAHNSKCLQVVYKIQFEMSFFKSKFKFVFTPNYKFRFRSTAMIPSQKTKRGPTSSPSTRPMERQAARRRAYHIKFKMKNQFISTFSLYFLGTDIHSRTQYKLDTWTKFQIEIPDDIGNSRFELNSKSWKLQNPFSKFKFSILFTRLFLN